MNLARLQLGAFLLVKDKLRTSQRQAQNKLKSSYGVFGARTLRTHVHREQCGVETEKELAHVTVSSLHVLT